TMEIVLFAGIIVHIVQAYIIAVQNKNARPVHYAVNKSGANSKWYSRSMTLLGTLILLFLIIHIKHFWWVSRITGLEKTASGEGNLFAEMQSVFAEGWVVIIYLLGVISLCWHLIHGFKSAFQTLGITHRKYSTFISNLGVAYSLIISFLFAMMPVAIFFGWIQ
ncbi:MAG: succinate dehydrogenase, partial [Chitinophagales bacterium]